MAKNIMGYERPVLIAGPCAAESEYVLWETARALKAGGRVSMFRCGVWKIRSKPDAFEGMGEAAMPVLQRIQRELGLAVCVETASPEQLESALRYGVDACWVGARTLVNPKQVAEIAAAARGTGMPFLLKNPLVPDLKLWEGAFERFEKAGIRELVAVYRGFASEDAAPYRNRPLWHLAIEWKRRHPDLPLVCDPSHLAGHRDWIQEVAQKALYLDVDGLMLEVHANPDKALSDASQQLSPQDFHHLLDVLRFPNRMDAGDALNAYRASIDELDTALLGLLSRRMEISRQIANVKREKQMPLLQTNRWQTVLDNALQKAEALHLDEAFVRDLMNRIHEASIEEQERTL